MSTELVGYVEANSNLFDLMDKLAELGYEFSDREDGAGEQEIWVIDMNEEKAESLKEFMCESDYADVMTMLGNDDEFRNLDVLVFF